MKPPIAFLSSFYQEVLYGDDRYNSPLWKLRQKLWAEYADKEREGNSAVWVAEKSSDNLWSEKDKLKVVDALVDVLLRSEVYICILADSRQSLYDHGSPIEIADAATATSYFEIELYAAAMYRKPIELFVLQGFDPGKRLRTLLDILKWALPDWQSKRAEPAERLFVHIKGRIEQHKQTRLQPPLPFRRRLVTSLYQERGRHAPPGREKQGVLFLDGTFEQRRELPQKDLVEHLIWQCEQVPQMQRKLNRIWLAARELMAASYLPKDVQSDGRLRDFLPLWNRVLSLWSSSAAWSGFHGHLYAGVIAPLNSQTEIRKMFKASERQTFPLDVWIMPFGGLASAHYSVAKLLPFGLRRFAILVRALRYIQWSMNESKRFTGWATPGEFAVRGSIRLQLCDMFGSLADFQRMIKLRRNQGAEDNELGAEFMHLGMGYAATGRFLKAREELRRSVQMLSTNPEDPNLPRAERHLATILSLTGKKVEAAQVRESARKHASRLGAMDQFR